MNENQICGACNNKCDSCRTFKLLTSDVKIDYTKYKKSIKQKKSIIVPTPQPTPTPTPILPEPQHTKPIDIKTYPTGKGSKLWSRKQYTSTVYTHDLELKESILAYLVRYKESDIRKGFYDNDLSYDWFYENIYSKPCKYCGTLEYKRGADRIDNSKGHSKENVVPSCGLCNNTRMDNFSVDEMVLLGAVIAQIRNNRLSS